MSITFDVILKKLRQKKFLELKFNLSCNWSTITWTTGLSFTREEET